MWIPGRLRGRLPGFACPTPIKRGRGGASRLFRPVPGEVLEVARGSPRVSAPHPAPSEDSALEEEWLGVARAAPGFGTKRPL